ncbi:glycoside hydrolase family 2 protein [Chitinophaga sancti]|uniref:Glycoside hydrolase family 2 TIM barrel-domain containing protein n=1 Tax=Chitinophaga sancti TaxID=1004 RepID=A0A1K1S5D2_9BACT|nr:sugar-binding domain-containing protein [Chitinophaga sancti]WQD63716.1 glycoside hydrolase family 2 TIM barrel-domain containing protein [Chitinophaga sancti]WQG90659.1 glycoside hydrolase family 2 TIM barrel-domain containing protein [Chitinophaga sancti]SFW79229.1 Glycosyl hydrolases family 2, TIM barrel domain [Chitinophaga sancti]
MKKFTLSLLMLGSMSYAVHAQQNSWHLIRDRIVTPWAEKVDPNAPLPEYPRPQLVRENSWKNLNGLWSYAITAVSQDKPAKYEGSILVPFAVESALSGVGRTVGKDSLLWYNTNISIPATMKGKEILLHFGAVDWQTEVFVNGKSAGKHEGGFDPFSFNITSLLKSGAKQDITIRVWDPTDDGPQPRGKQVKQPEGIWYTPVTGIWQTVWLEAVPKTYIASTKNTPDIDHHTISVNTNVEGAQAGDQVKVEVLDGGNVVATQEVAPSATAVLTLQQEKLWSTTHPYLYDLKVTLTRKGKTVDAVKSYFAMRKISMAPDQNGIQRMMLNNEFVFQYGPLDQGWYPDGLYTAATHEAMIYDIDQLQKMGFNMIRKHIKLEPATYYRYCDEKGMLLWQDMPSGDLGNGWENRPGILDHQTDKQRTAESEGYYRKEWNAIMDAAYNFPCIVVWTPFNEAWGQFKTVEITEWTMKKDPSRLVNSASGGNFYETGHIIDLHNYPAPAMPRPDLFGKKQVLVLGEFGGLGLPLEGHNWQGNKNWGYQSFKNSEEMFKKYQTFTKRLAELIPLGLSAAVYTQTTDVEGEVNGFMTYDRKVDKFPVQQLGEDNRKLYEIKVK